MPAGRTHNARATALALAVGVNGAFLWLLLSSHREPPVQQQAIVAMIWIDPVVPPPPTPPPPPKPAATPVPRKEAAVEDRAEISPPAPVQPAPEVRSASTTSIDVPWIDWSEEAAKMARDVVRKEELAAQSRGSLKSEPKVMVLPKERGNPQGHVEHFEGGVTMSFDDDCATTSNPQEMGPWALDPVGKFFGQSASARWFSKGGGCGATQSSKRAAALEKAVKPRYLGGTKPPPEEETSSVPIKIP